MGVVWRAHDRLLDREVAVKEVVISALIGEDERRNAYQRTLREARTAARLSHRGVVAIYDVVEEDGRPWIIMELVPSQSLDQVLVVDGRLPPTRAGRIGRQLLSALAAAHVAGVLHRDVKPSNVLIATNRTGEGWDERAVLTDFGIAQFEGDPRLTQTGMVMGSPGFTAPERIRGSDATPASDLWSLGATIFAAVEGRGPYENRGGAITTMSAIINEDAPVAPHAGPLASVIAALLRRNPSARPAASMAARMFAQALLQMPEASAEPPAMAHPPTIRSSYVPRPAAPAVSASVTAPDSARAGKKPAPAAGEVPAREIPVTQATAVEDQAREAPAEEAEEAVEAVSAEAGEQDAADSAAPQPEPEAGAAAGSAPAAAAPADAKPQPEPDENTEPEANAEPDENPEPGAKPEPGAGADSGSRPEPTAESDAESTDEPAAVTAKFAASAEKSAAVSVPGPPPADAPAAKQAAEQKAAPAALLVPAAADEESGSPGADTVIPRKGATERQSPPVPVPVARVAPSAAAPAQPEPPEPEPKSGPEPKSEPPKSEPPEPALPDPAPPKPTFTAAKPTDRPVPTFSAVNPARAATPGRPTPPRLANSGSLAAPASSQRPAYGQGGASQGYPPPGKGRTTPLSGGSFPSHAGPSQASPGPSWQYPAGPGGGAGQGGRRGLGRKAAWAVAAVIVAAAVGVGAALALNHDNGSGGAANAGNTSSATAVPSVQDTPTGFKSIDALNNPSTALPAGWTTTTVTQAKAGSAAAGFSIDVPPGWKVIPKGLATDFSGPDGLVLEVDLTQQSTSDMLTAATQVESASKARFPGYKRLNLRAEPVRHAEGAVWKFQWTPSGGVQETADDIFFAQATPSGVQDYAVYIRSPSATFGSMALPLFDEMLPTFQTVPAR